MQLLYFGGVWCKPCAMAKSELGKYTQEKEHIKTMVIDVDSDIEICAANDIHSIPTYILLDDEDKEIKRHNGPLKLSKLKEFIGI